MWQQSHLFLRSTSTLGSDGVFPLVFLSYGNIGLDQSDHFGSAVGLPVASGTYCCLDRGSWCGSFTMDTNASFPSDGRLRLLM